MIDGGPAFPTPDVLGPYGYNEAPDVKPGHSGMTLRQWYAGLAMQAMLSSETAQVSDWHPAPCAKRAHEFADAMLAEDRRTQP